MSKKRSDIISAKTPKPVAGINNAMASVYLILMFSAFPFFLSNYYGNARRDKFWFLVVLTAVFVASMIFVHFATKITRDPKNIKPIYKDKFSLNLIDIGILAFLLVNILSTVFALLNGGDFNSYLISNDGRNMGLLTVFMLTLAYFMVSRYFYVNTYIFVFIMLGMGVMSFLAIVNYYYFDPLGIFKMYQTKPSVIKDFTSTIGNKNFLSALICIALPFSVGLSIATKNKLTHICSYISVGVQFMALIVATSDSGFLGCFFAFLIMLIVASRDLKKLSKLFTCFAIMIASAKLLWLFDIIMKGKNKGYTSISEVVIYNHWLFALIPIFIAFAVIFSKLNDENGSISKLLFITSIVIFVATIIVIAILFLYYSVWAPDAEVGDFTSFFRFNDDWGTHRGFMWKRSIQVFQNLSLREKLFGVGPDSFKAAFKPYNNELYIKYGETHTTAAHSVYLNYLVTVGLLGLISYLIFLGAAIANVVKYSFENPLALACVAPIVAYISQDIVNIASPVDTPWFFLVIALSQASHLNANNSERCNSIL